MGIGRLAESPHQVGLNRQKFVAQPIVTILAAEGDVLAKQFVQRCRLRPVDEIVLTARLDQAIECVFLTAELGLIP